MLKLLKILNLASHVSPELQDTIRKLLDQLKSEAAKTPGSADDHAVALITAIFAILGLY